MDLKKEIKLSDLVPKRGGGGTKKEQPPARRKKKSRAASNGEIVGLKVGATGIRAAQVVNNGGKHLLRTASMSLPTGVIDGGEVRDPVALGEALADFFAANQLPRKGVRLGLANSRIGVRVIEIGGIEDEAQLENAIRFRAHEMLSVPVDEAVIDYDVLSTDVDDDGGVTRKVLVVVAYRDSIDRYLAAMDAAKVELTGIDLAAFALLRAVAVPAEEGEQRAALIAASIGHERTTLAISDGRICQFARVLEWGGADLGTAVARALKISPVEAEQLKPGISLVEGQEAVEGLQAARAAEAIAAVRYELQNLIRELLSSLRFYQSQEGSLPIGEILVAGGTSAMPGLVEELSRELGIPVRLADPFTRVELAEGLALPEHPGALAIAVGLGVED
jgi:type IV pilus assembly protein PilM